MLCRVWPEHSIEKRYGSIVRQSLSQTRREGMLEVDLAIVHSHQPLARFGYLGRSVSWLCGSLPAYVVEVV